MKNKENHSNTSLQKTNLLLSLQHKLQTLKQSIQNELKLKKIIHRAQKIDFMSNLLPEDKLDMKHSLYVNIFLLFNSLIVGAWMFSNKEYRKFKYFSIYMIAMTYLGVSVGLFWEDESFLRKISSRDDAYKSQMKYLLRKECLEDLRLDRIQYKKQLFKRLNLEFEDFHKVNINQRSVDLLV